MEHFSTSHRFADITCQKDYSTSRRLLGAVDGSDPARSRRTMTIATLAVLQSYLLPRSNSWFGSGFPGPGVGFGGPGDGLGGGFGRVGRNIRTAEKLLDIIGIGLKSNPGFHRVDQDFDEPTIPLLQNLLPDRARCPCGRLESRGWWAKAFSLTVSRTQIPWSHRRAPAFFSNLTTPLCFCPLATRNAVRPAVLAGSTFLGI